MKLTPVAQIGEYRYRFEPHRVPAKKRRAGWEDLQPAVNDERSERTRSVPSVAGRRVAAPYGVDGRFGAGKVDFK